MHRMRHLTAFFCFLLLCGNLTRLPAEPTHELTQKFKASISGETLVLEAGTPVEVMQLADPTAFVKHTLPNGKSTILQIPVSQLQKIQTLTTAPAATATAASSDAPTAPTSVQPAAVTKNNIKLATKEGKAFEGLIIRVERTVVVLHMEEDQVEDVPLSSLDEPSMALAKSWESQSQGKPAIHDPRVIPGKKISLSFPELGASNQSDPARIQIRIPENYKADQPVPLALFLGGGAGSDNCDALNSFVDSKDYILVAFPYSKAYSSPMKAYHAGHSKELIAFQKPMLERLQALVPNSDPDHRVVIGTSNGAHSIGVASCDGWDEFTDFFSAYVLHEGGGSQSGNFKNLKRKNVYVMMGDSSPNKAFAESIARSVEKSNSKAETYSAPGEGHGMGDDSRRAAKAWIEKIRSNPK